MQQNVALVEESHKEYEQRLRQAFRNAQQRGLGMAPSLETL